MMLAVSNAFNEAFKSDLREVKMRIKINDVTYTDEDIISFNFNSGSIVGETFAIGSTYANSIKLTFCKIVEGLKQLDVVVPEIGIVLPNGSTEYVKLGTFLISEEVNPDRNENRTSLECTDRMLMLDDFYESKLKYPAEIRAVALEIANLAGVEVDKVSFGRLRQDKIKQPIGYTYREAIGLIAQFEAGYVTFDRNGLLAIRLLEDKDYRVTPDEYFLKGLVKNELIFRPAGIQVSIGDEEEKNLTIGNKKGSVIKLENKLMTENLLKSIYEKIKNINYYPYSLNWRGNPAVEAGDWLRVTDTKGNQFKVPNLSYSLEYKGGLTATSTVETVASNEVKMGYKTILEQTIEYVNESIKDNGTEISYGVEEPPNPKEGDIWFKYNGPDTEIWIYEKVGEPDIFDWVLKISSAVDDTIKDKIDELEQTSKDVSESVDKALEEAEIARKEAFSSIKIASEAKADVVKVQSEVDDAKKNADEALKKAESNSGKITTINGEVNKQGLEIKQIDDELQIQNAKVEANTSSVASLKVESDKIATEVIKTNEKVDNLEFSGDNLAHKSLVEVHQGGVSKPKWISDDTFEVIYKKGDVVPIRLSNLTPEKDVVYSVSYYMYINDEPVKYSDFLSKTVATNVRPSDRIRFNVDDSSGKVIGSNKYTTSWFVHSSHNLVAGDVITIKKLMIVKNEYPSSYITPVDVLAKQSEVTKLSTQIEQTAEAVKIKADKSDVDTINKTVKEQHTLIEANSEEIRQKATKSEVDTINDTVKVHESEINTHSEQIKLQTSKIDSHTTEISNIKVESDKISTTVAKVNQDVQSLEVGNRNLAYNLQSYEPYNSKPVGYQNGLFWKTNVSNINLSGEKTIISLSRTDKKPVIEKEYTISCDIKVDGKVADDDFLKDINTLLDEKTIFSIEKGRLTAKLFINRATSWYMHALVNPKYHKPQGEITEVIFENLQISEGNTIVNYTIAPEFLATQTQMSNVTQTVQGLQVSVQNKAEQSEVTIMSNQLNSTIKRVDGTQSKITQLSNQIDLKISANEVISRINMSPERIRIDSKLIHLSGRTLIDDAVIKNVMIANGAIDNAKIQNATISDAKIISVTANKIVANTLSAITTNTGTLNVTGWMNILTANNGIMGQFDFGDDPTVAYPRWYDGDFRLSHRHLVFGANQYSVNSNGSKGRLHGHGESFYGANYYKSRWYSGANATGVLKGRIDIRDNFIQVADEWGEDQMVGTYIMPSTVFTREINVNNITARNTAENIWFNPARTNLADFRIGHDGNGKIVQSKAIYDRTYSWSGGNVTVTDAGAIGRATSASKYKLNISEIPDELDYAKQLLNVKPKKWFDKESAEIYSRKLDNELESDDYFIGEIYGLIAEDVEEAGLSKYCQYNTKTGEIEGISYDKLTTLLIPLVKDLYKKIDVLERNIANENRAS